jgi:PAS domain S-box-containing protein
VLATGNRPSPASFTGWSAAPRSTDGWRGYAIAAAALAATVVLRLVLEFLFDDRAPTFMVFLLPVIATGFLAGFWPGMACCAAGWLVALYFFVDPPFSFKYSAEDFVVLGVFAVEGAVIAAAGGALRQALRRLLEREEQLAHSEARLQLAQSAAGIATYEWVLGTGEVSYSENAEAIMGFAPGTFGGTYADSMRNVLPEDRGKLEKAAAELTSTGSHSDRFRIRTYSGEIRWVGGSATLIRGADGAAERVVGVVRDVTEAQRASQNARFLADATAELSSSFDYRTTLANVARMAVPGFADMCVVAAVEAGGGIAEVVAIEHSDPNRRDVLSQVKEALQELPEREGVVAQAVRAGQPLFMPSLPPDFAKSAAVSTRHLEALTALDPGGLVCIPTSARGRTLGALVFVNERGRPFTAEDFELACELGRRAALAIENSMLLDQSFDREAEISRANEALQLIADAGMALNSSLDPDAMLESLAQLVVGRFAEGCSITMVEDEIPQNTVSAYSSEALRAALERPADAPRDQELYETALQALRSDRPIYLREIDDQLLGRMMAGDPPSAPELRPRSAIIMPLSARGQTVGVMSFVRFGDSPAFDREDLSLAGQIARRTAVAADNARLYLEARRANEAKDEFLGMMSHELRTPITMIQGGARILQTRVGMLDDETRDTLLQDIARESERLSRMLENLLSLARAELDRDITPEPVLLQRLLPRLVTSMSDSLGRDVRTCLEADAPAVLAEPGYIEQVLRNLVTNAVKYSPPDSPIEISLSPASDGAAIRVMDRGFGIAPSEVDRIFERFYRSDRTSRLAGGAGLGLAVCKRLIEAMSGEIWAKPRDGGGLEVGFRLPAEREESEAHEH